MNLVGGEFVKCLSRGLLVEVILKELDWPG